MRALAAWSLLALLVFPASTALIYGGLMLSPGKALEGLLIGCMAAPAATFLFFLMGQSTRKQIVRQREWRQTELGG